MAKLVTNKATEWAFYAENIKTLKLSLVFLSVSIHWGFSRKQNSLCLIEFSHFLIVDYDCASRMTAFELEPKLSFDYNL